jgi:hypothetical protein
MTSIWRTRKRGREEQNEVSGEVRTYHVRVLGVDPTRREVGRQNSGERVDSVRRLRLDATARPALPSCAMVTPDAPPEKRERERDCRLVAAGYWRHDSCSVGTLESGLLGQRLGGCASRSFG